MAESPVIFGRFPEHYPQSLINQLGQCGEKFAERCEAELGWLQQHCENDSFYQQLLQVWSCSQYVAELCFKRPDMFKALVDSGDLQRSYSNEEWQQRYQQLCASLESAGQLSTTLRESRAREMLRIIWRDLNRLADLKETTRDISLLAECSLEQALEFHYQKLCEELGTPCATIKGEKIPQRMIVLGMGKLGAYELNLSSDIDLMFCYPHSGETEGGKKCVDNNTFFTRLGQRLIEAIDKLTADGFVFRVDMRLRPYGQSGALVLSFSAMEEYYQDQGRDWERYAMIKARVVAGDKVAGEELMTRLRPFIYRRYIDYSAIESLRSMKKMIQQEVKRRHLENDIKLGSGGIREVEFIAQTFQLIRGGREEELQDRRLLVILGVLAANGYLPATAVEELKAAYIFLRNTEHALQAFNDAQTQALPEYDYPRAALVAAMGFEQWDEFYAVLSQHRDNVALHFSHIVAPPEEETEQESSALNEKWLDIWLHEPELELAQLWLKQSGHEQAETVTEALIKLRDSNAVQRMQAIGRERLNQFMPLLLQAVTEADKPSETLLRILPLVESVLRRTAYLVLVVENPVVMRQLITLCSASPWISSQLTRYPALLDELLDTRNLYTVPDKKELQEELQLQALRIPWDDLEAHMEMLRYFKLAHVLRVAASEVVGRLPLMKVSDYLTYIAEVAVEHTLELAWHNLTEKHGYPVREDGERCDKDFIVVAYGKMGGIELGYKSDLDLVFIHNAASGKFTDGDRALDNSMFFTRLGQRMIHILSTHTPQGMLYEVDMRLRPSGASGLLVSSLKAFEDYQQNQAWTWEHQALVRARVIAGDRQLKKAFIEKRRGILAQQRDEAELKKAVVAMRHKMRDHLLPAGYESEKPIFHLKHGSGGIVDIEFMVQYAVLAWSHQYPSLTDWTDNIRILESLQREGLFSEQEANDLTEAYKLYRSDAHRASLQEQASEVALDKYAEQREQVIAKWQNLLGSDPRV
jgi:glutamate-ammonia-ligase adenylyltransferase